jgi:vancomycin resistance protein YoaR
VLAVGAGVLVAVSYTWGESLRDEGRLLPGTTIGSVDVGGATQRDAIAQVEASLAAELDRPVTIDHDGQGWETTARDLGATTEAAEVVARAYEHTADASLTELTRMRWAGGTADVRLDAGVTLDDAAIVAYVDEIADEVDRDPHAASLRWDGKAFDVAEHRIGTAVDRHQVSVELARALLSGDDSIELAVDELEPRLTTASARDQAAAIEAAVEETLERTVTLTHSDASWQVTPSDLDATADVEPLVEAALAGDELPAVPVDLPQERTEELVTTLAEEIDAGVRDARIELFDDGMRVAPARVIGQAASRGCVRMYNSDVIDLYDRVSTGTTIASIRR